MDSQNQVTSTDPPALAPSDQPQQQSDDSQDALQEGSSRSSSQMPELEQMEDAGPVQIVVVAEGETSEDVGEAMEVGQGEEGQIIQMVEENGRLVQVVQESTPVQEDNPQVLDLSTVVQDADQVVQEATQQKPVSEVASSSDQCTEADNTNQKPVEQLPSQDKTQSKESTDDVDAMEDDSADAGEASQKTDSNVETSKEEKETASKVERQPDTKIVLTLAAGGATSASKRDTSDVDSTTEGAKREVVLSFNMQDMLAATDVKESDGQQSTTAMPVSINVAVPHKTRQSTKRAATSTKESPVSSPAAKKQRQQATPPSQKSAEFAQAIGLKSTVTPVQTTPPQTDSSIRRSSRRKSGTPKWRPKDLLESDPEEESSAEEGEVRPSGQTKKRGRPSKPGHSKPQAKTPTPAPATSKKTPTVTSGRNVKVKTEPVDKVKIKVEKDPEWYNGKPKTSWSKKEEKSLVTYITDWQKQPPIEDIEEEEEEEDENSNGQMSQKEFDEMSLMIPKKENEKDWKECADFVSKSTQKPIRKASDCQEFAVTIQECMTNEGVMDHYNLDGRKVKSAVQTANAKKPLRNKQAANKAFWTDDEEQALVVFILNWQIKPKSKMVRTKVKVTRLKVVKTVAKPSISDGEFAIMPTKSNLWEDCARFISRKACLPKRTGTACRNYALGIQKKFTKEEAIKHYNLESGDVDSDIEEIEPSSTSYDAYLQDDSFLFNLWLSNMGRLTKYQEDHVLHRLLLKKIDRNEFNSSEFLYYFKHMSRDKQEETADLLQVHGLGSQGDGEEQGMEEGEEETVKSKEVSTKVSQFTAFASNKRRSMDNFEKQMQVNLHQSEKQLKNLREMLGKLQKENKSLKTRIKTLKEVVERMSNIRAPRQAWSIDMDAELNPFRKKILFQWMLMNGFIPRMPREDCVVPKGLFYCIFTAMEELAQQGRPNAVFHLAKALSLRKTNGERVMPANRMPFAMLEANIMFFGGKGYNFIQQEGYKRWVETQYAWFGEVWFSLFGGPNMKSLAGEEPKPMMGLTEDYGRVQVKKERVYSYSYKPEPESIEDKRFTLSMCPEGFTPSEEEKKDLIKVGSRWGKMHPIGESTDVSDGKTADDISPVATRKSSRRAAKSSSEGEASTSQGEKPATESASPITSPSAASTPSGRRRGKTAAISYMTKEHRRPVKMESSAYSLDIDDVDKFLEEINEGMLPQGLNDIWDDPPDFSFEDDFIVPENSDLNKVRLNIVSGTPRAVRRRAMERENISEPDATIRVELLEKLRKINPNAKWWIKTGWCDISVNKSLRITTNQEFTGDENLGDGAIKEAEDVYRERLKNTRTLGTAPRKSENALREDLFRHIADLQDDNIFLCEGLRQVRATRGIYKNKMGVPERAAVDQLVDKEISSYTKLLEKNQQCRARVERALSQGARARVITLRNDLCEYISNLTIRQRTLANFVLIFMVSDELQNENPHSWPVRIVPVATVTKEIVETLREQLIEAMTKQSMQIVGVIRDELTPHLQVCRPDRPVCITQLISESRTEVSTFHPSEMEKYFTTVTLFSRSGDMKLTPQWRHGAVPEEDVLWVHKHMSDNNASFLEGLQALHKRLFPDGYTPHPFKQITKFVDMDAQMLEDQLRALMAVYIFRHKIKTYVAEGIDFDSYMYVPTEHRLTRDALHVRDSVTKLLRAVSRQAKDDPELTVEKRERLSRALDAWFKASVNKWWTEDMRKQGNQALFTYFMDEWVPWLSADRGYSTLDVNRPISKVSFLTEDLLTSLVINLESENQRQSLHPIAATCQDVNTFVHLIKNPGQRHNDSRQVMHTQIIKKLCIEFAKAVDPELEFYYYWGDHEKTLYNILLNLNDPRTKRSATGPKYRKKSIGGTPQKQTKGGKIVKAEVEEVEEEDSRDATEEEMDDEMMDVSGVNEDEDSMASSTHSRANQPQGIINMNPIPISINQADIIMAPSAINQADIDTAQALNQLSDMETIQVINQGNMQVVRVLKQGETVKVGDHSEMVQVVSQGEPGQAEQQGEVTSHGEMVQDGNQAQMQTVQAVGQGNMVQVGNQGQMVQVVSQGEQVHVGNQGQMVQVVSQGEPVHVGNQGQMIQVVSQAGDVQVGNQHGTVQYVSQGETVQVGNEGQMVQVISHGEDVQVGNQGQMIQVVNQGEDVQVGNQGQMVQVVSQGEPVHVGNQGQMVQVVSQAGDVQVGHQGGTVQYVTQGEPVQMGNEGQMVQVVSHGEGVQVGNQGETVQVVVSQGEPVHVGNQGQMIQVVSHGEGGNQHGTVQYVSQGEPVQVGNEGQMVQIVSQAGETVQVGNEGQMVQVVSQGETEPTETQAELQTVVAVSQGETVQNQDSLVQVVSQGGMETVQIQHPSEMVQVVNQGEMETVQVVNQGEMETVQVVNQGEMETVQAVNQGEMETVQVVNQGEMETVQVVNQGEMETVQVVNQGEMESVQVVSQGETDQVENQSDMQTVQVVSQGELVQIGNQEQMVQVVSQGEMETVEVVHQDGSETVQVVNQGETETVQVVNQADGVSTQTTSTQVVTVTTSAPTVTTEGASSSGGQATSPEDIIAAELLRQIEASLQAGAVVTVTESSEG